MSRFNGASSAYCTQEIVLLHWQPFLKNIFLPAARAVAIETALSPSPHPFIPPPLFQIICQTTPSRWCLHLYPQPIGLAANLSPNCYTLTLAVGHFTCFMYKVNWSLVSAGVGYCIGCDVNDRLTSFVVETSTTNTTKQNSSDVFDVVTQQITVLSTHTNCALITNAIVYI